MAYSHRRSVRIDSRAIALIAFTASLLCFGGAQAKQSDRDQPVAVAANWFSGSQDSGKATYKGDVKISQGTLHADGDNATGYFDQDNQVQRVVLTGNPAHMSQQMDDGSNVHGQADTIDYTVSQNTVVLTGDAVVVHEGQGEFHGAKLTYNTDTGQIVGEGGTGGQVHMILQPQRKAAPAKKPAAASSAATTPAQPATTAPAKPASTAPALDLSLHPATASSTH
jgi:lipopolysaccharide export system protein LptA